MGEHDTGSQQTAIGGVEQGDVRGEGVAGSPVHQNVQAQLRIGQNGPVRGPGQFVAKRFDGPHVTPLIHSICH